MAYAILYALLRLEIVVIVMNSYLKSSNTHRRNKVIYLLSLIPLILYAIYKNGILAYNRHLIGFLGIFKPLYLVILGSLICYTYLYISNKYIHKNKDIKKEFKNSYEIIYVIILTLSLPIKTPILFYTLSVLIYLLGSDYLKRFKINVLSIVRLLLILMLVLLNKYTYMNVYEDNILTAYTTFDMFFGRIVGSMGGVSSVLLIISYLILLFNPSYKREIPIFIVVTYFIVSLGFGMFTHDIKDVLKLMLTNEVLFPSIYVATVSLASPILNNKKIIYGVGIGILGFVLARFMGKEGIYVAIVIMNIILIMLEKIGEVVAKKS